MRPMARSTASIERSVVREWFCSFERDSLAEGSWAWPPVSMLTPPVRTLSILEKLRLLPREEPLKVVPSRVKEMPWGCECRFWTWFVHWCHKHSGCWRNLSSCVSPSGRTWHHWPFRIWSVHWGGVAQRKIPVVLHSVHKNLQCNNLNICYIQEVRAPFERHAYYGCVCLPIDSAMQKVTSKHLISTSNHNH